MKMSPAQIRVANAIHRNGDKDGLVSYVWLLTVAPMRTMQSMLDRGWLERMQFPSGTVLRLTEAGDKVRRFGNDAP